MPQATKDPWQRHSSKILVWIAAGGLLAGLALSGQAASRSHLVWTATTLLVPASLFFQVLGALRRGDVGLDIVAALSMSAAIALGESLAANVVASCTRVARCWSLTPSDVRAAKLWPCWDASPILRCVTVRLDSRKSRFRRPAVDPTG